MNYFLYDESTGEIAISGVCQPEDFDLQVKEGLVLMEGYATYFQNYVVNGQIKTYTTEQIQAKSVKQMPYMKWSNSSFSWVDTRTQTQINNDAEANVRLQRDTLLYQSDWTQIPNNPLTTEKQQEWAVYRQQLRDVTNQSGFPLNVIFPVPPT